MYLFLSLKGRQSFIFWSVLSRFHLLYNCCHSLSLIAIFAVTGCHSLYHPLLLIVPHVVTRCTTRYHLLSLDVPLVCLFINDLSELLNNFLHNYSIIWDSMDMICIVLKKTITRNLPCSCCFEKEITNWIFKIPIGSAQSQHSTVEKTYCKTSCFSIIVLTLDR